MEKHSFQPRAIACFVAEGVICKKNISDISGRCREYHVWMQPITVIYFRTLSPCYLSIMFIYRVDCFPELIRDMRLLESDYVRKGR